MRFREKKVQWDIDRNATARQTCDRQLPMSTNEARLIIINKRDAARSITAAVNCDAHFPSTRQLSLLLNNGTESSSLSAHRRLRDTSATCERSLYYRCTGGRENAVLHSRNVTNVRFPRATKGGKKKLISVNVERLERIYSWERESITRGFQQVPRASRYSHYTVYQRVYIGVERMNAIFFLLNR